MSCKRFSLTEIKPLKDTWLKPVGQGVIHTPHSLLIKCDFFIIFFYFKWFWALSLLQAVFCLSHTRTADQHRQKEPLVHYSLTGFTLKIGSIEQKYQKWVVRCSFVISVEIFVIFLKWDFITNK